jgi:hypothetical protein
MQQQQAEKLTVCHYPIDSRVGRSLRSHTEAVSDDDYTKSNEKNVIKVAPLISPEICSANSHHYFGLLELRFLINLIYFIN